MKISKKELKETIRNIIKEETQYQIFFKKALDKFGVSSPDEFESEEKKKEFFDYVDNNWKADNESVTEDEDPCWDDYEMVGMKKKNGKEVPNCVPKNENIIKENIRDFEKFVGKSLKSDPDKIKKAVEWFAGSVYGDVLPNNLHKDDVNASHIKKVVDKIKKEMKDDPEFYGPKVMNAFLKKTDISGAKKLMESINESKVYEENTEYQKFFRKAMKKFGVSEPDELDREEKKKFFNYVDKHWHAKDERVESINEIDYDTAISEFKRDLEKHTAIDKMVKHYGHSTKKVINALMTRIKVNKYNDGSIKKIAINFLDRPSGVVVKHDVNYSKNEGLDENAEFRHYARMIIEGQMNERASVEAEEIAHYTGSGAKGVQSWLDRTGINGEKLAKYVRKGSLQDRLDVVSAIVGRPKNKYHNKLVKMFGESVINETKFFVWYKKKKHEVEADSLYKAKKKFIDKHNVPKSQQSKLAIKSAGSMDAGDFRFS